MIGAAIPSSSMRSRRFCIDPLYVDFTVTMSNISPTWWEIAGGVTALLTVGEILRRYGKSLIRKLLPWIMPSGVPREAIRIVPSPHSLLWCSASVAGKPAMQVMATFHVTNITKQPISIPQAHLEPPGTLPPIVSVRHPEQNVYGGYPLYIDPRHRKTGCATRLLRRCGRATGL